jgi:uncharacterized protein
VSKRLIIAATSARGYAEAALASGYEVIALDAFADADLKRIAKQAYKIKMHDWRLDVEDFKQVFSDLDLSEIEGFLYGSLFDATPELLEWVAARVQVIGNTPEVLKKAKAFSFFNLLDDLQIQHPDVRTDAPVQSLNWLSKQIGGSGGMHVRPASSSVSADYFQREVVGEPVSMLFVANGKEAQIIGFNRQLVAPTPELPYRFVGAVSGVKLPDTVEKVFCEAAPRLTAALGLRGICSLDAVLEDETLSMLELNPRLSASFELYPNLMSAHVQGCVGNLTQLPVLATSKAQLILYADNALVLPLDFAWPAWVIDIPPADQASNNIVIEKNTPICSVRAEAATAELAFSQVMQRAKILKEMMQ